MKLYIYAQDRVGYLLYVRTVSQVVRVHNTALVSAEEERWRVGHLGGIVCMYVCIQRRLRKPTTVKKMMIISSNTYLYCSSCFNFSRGHCGDIASLAAPQCM